MNQSNSIIVLCGGSCTGKDTTAGILRQRHPNLQIAVSHTTRPPRVTEKEGVEYFFINQEEFSAMFENGEFVEIRKYEVVPNQIEVPWNDNILIFENKESETWYYGMSEKEMTRKLKVGHVLMILDLEGLKEIINYYQDSEVKIYPFYIDVDVDTRIQRYLKRDNITLAMVKEGIRRIESDEKDFKGIEYYATSINNPPTSEMTAFAVENYLANFGIKLD